MPKFGYAYTYAIKPNLHELKSIARRELRTEKEIVAFAKELNSTGIELVFVSNGAKGIILTTRNCDGYLKSIYKVNRKLIIGEEIGCGDAVVGGIAVGIKNKLSEQELLKLAISCGTANLFSEGPGVCKKSDINITFKKVLIKKQNFLKK